MRGKIKEGWFEAGKVNGQMWTPILNDDEEDPNWIKTAAVEIIKND